MTSGKGNQRQGGYRVGRLGGQRKCWNSKTRAKEIRASQNKGGGGRAKGWVKHGFYAYGGGEKKTERTRGSVVVKEGDV